TLDVALDGLPRILLGPIIAGTAYYESLVWVDEHAEGMLMRKRSASVAPTTPTDIAPPVAAITALTGMSTAIYWFSVAAPVCAPRLMRTYADEPDPEALAEVP